MRRLIQGEVPLLQSFTVVKTQPSERRLVLRASTKGARSQLIGAIREARGSYIRISAALSLQERVNRAYVHREAQLANLIVVDRGDRCFLLPKGGPKPARDVPIDYSGDISGIQKALAEAKRCIRDAATAGPPPPRNTPHLPGLRHSGRSYAEAASGQRQMGLQRPSMGYRPPSTHPDRYQQRPQPFRPPPQRFQPPPHHPPTYPPPTAPHPTGPPPPQEGITTAQLQQLLDVLQGRGRIVTQGQQVPPGFPGAPNYGAAVTAHLQPTMGVSPYGYGQASWRG